MKFRRPKDEAEIPTASMADIAFLLIVFFMLTAVFAETRGINFAVPPDKPPEPQSEKPEEAVHIKIEPTGSVTIDDNPIERADIIDDLGGYLLPKLRRNPEKPILVTAEKDSPYGAFVEIYDALRHVENELKDEGKLPRQNALKVSIPSLAEIEALKAQFGADIFD